MAQVSHSDSSLVSRFRHWRRTRPFWGGLWAILGGVFLAQLLVVPLGFLSVAARMSMTTWTVAGIIILCGLFFWFKPEQRTFVALVCALVAVLSFPATNFGGFGVGMLLSLLGASMAFGWKENSTPAHAADAQRAEVAA